MKLHLGVVEVLYANSSYAKPKKKERVGDARKGNPEAEHSSGGVVSTGDVAEILEDHYHVMENFIAIVGGDMIRAAIEHSVAGAIENVILGGPVSISPSAEAMSEIESAFKHFLSQQEMDGVQSGVPTQAALDGVSHRFKHPHAKRPPRPSFIDTGLYQANFHAWVDDE